MLYYKSGALYCSIHPEKKTYFYEDGTLKTVENYQQDRLHGEALLYWPNGQLKRKSFFLNGIRHGLDQMWNEEGGLVDEGSYEMGKPVGFHRRFSQGGSLIEEIEYFEPLRFNLRQWDEEGEIRVEAIWAEQTYHEKAWDRFQKIWIERKGVWDGKKLVYL